MSYKLSDEEQYLQVLKEVFTEGELRETRNGNTISKFGMRMEFDISEKFPLLTSKRVYWMGVLKELLWFIKGNTDAKLLANDNVHIWDGNSNKEFHKKVNLEHYKEGDCGPIYGFQWRYFGAEYQGPIEEYFTGNLEPGNQLLARCHGDRREQYSKEGFDQLAEVIHLLKTDPHSRRIFMSAWNPKSMKDMVLPPCHVSYQFYVDSQNRLSCQMYQRSGDLFLGVPFNIASTSALTYLLAHHCGLQTGKVIIVIGDAHIYECHKDQVQEQLNRWNDLRPFPTLKIKNLKENIEDYDIFDFLLEDYNPHPTIKAEMVA
jgi:thymidylate synthase